MLQYLNSSAEIVCKVLKKGDNGEYYIEVLINEKKNIKGVQLVEDCI